jgi:putative transposase
MGGALQIKHDQYRRLSSGLGRSVELNPVRAGIVADSADYRWSSYGAKIGNRDEACLDDDPCYPGLAGSPEKRAARCAAWVKGATSEEEWPLIRQSLQRGQLTGGAHFVDEIARKVERRVEFRGQGRPKKAKNKSVPIYVRPHLRSFTFTQSPFTHIGEDRRGHSE